MENIGCPRGHVMGRSKVAQYSLQLQVFKGQISIVQNDVITMPYCSYSNLANFQKKLKQQ